jgi:hypothetical protein
MAYPIRHHQDGLYLYVLFQTEGDISNTIERKLRLREAILRLQVVRVDEELRRAKVDVSSILPRLEVPEAAAPAAEVEAETETEAAEGETAETEPEAEAGAETTASAAGEEQS